MDKIDIDAGGEEREREEVGFVKVESSICLNEVTWVKERGRAAHAESPWPPRLARIGEGESKTGYTNLYRWTTSIFSTSMLSWVNWKRFKKNRLGTDWPKGLALKS